MNSSALLKYKVMHRRLVPKGYSFVHKLFWFKLDLFKLDELRLFGVGINQFNIYSFYDKDHLDLGKETAKENYIEFVKRNGVEAKIVSAVLYTNLRFMGYVFNPISMVFFKDEHGKQYAVLEVGNTFNEIKPFFVGDEAFTKDGFSLKFKKLFYISPFIEHDNDFIFKFNNQSGIVDLSIDDFKESEKILEVKLSGKEIAATNKNLFHLSLKTPFITFLTIILIHFHALVLFMKGIKYFKKDEFKELQVGTFLWKTSNKQTKE